MEVYFDVTYSSWVTEKKYNHTDLNVNNSM